MMCAWAHTQTECDASRRSRTLLALPSIARPPTCPSPLTPPPAHTALRPDALTSLIGACSTGPSQTTTRPLDRGQSFARYAPQSPLPCASVPKTGSPLLRSPRPSSPSSSASHAAHTQTRAALPALAASAASEQCAQGLECPSSRRN